jgi:hypothetical protein
MSYVMELFVKELIKLCINCWGNSFTLRPARICGALYAVIRQSNNKTSTAFDNVGYHSLG